MVGRLAAIHLRFAGAEGGRPHGAVVHADIHIKARGVDGQMVEAVAGDAKQHRRQPPDHTAARLGYECVHSAVGQILRLQMSAAFADSFAAFQ